MVTASRSGDLPDRVRRLLADADRDEAVAPVVVGALPFNATSQPHVFQPDRWVRRLPTSNVHAPWPEAPGRHPERWTVRAVPPRADYRRAVAAALAAMAQDDTPRKVVLARTLQLDADAPIDPALLFSRLSIDRAVTTFAVPLRPCAGGQARALIGATPELLAAKQGLAVSSRPLAGSARRRPAASDDRDAAETLARSEKDRREHATVVEWIADRLAPFCRTLKVPHSPSLVSTASMWHLGSTIEGTLRDPDTSSLEVALALHPTPAVCGTPHDWAATTIDALEPFDRDFYAGAVGWNDARGNGEWFVAIRCAEICGASARLFAGAGIVRGSSPAAEAAETSAKFVALLRALGIDEEGRTFSGADL